jgi:hypothetical protein
MSCRPTPPDWRRGSEPRWPTSFTLRHVCGRWLPAVRISQIRAPKNRHLVDVRQVERLPPYRTVEGVQVIESAHLAAMKAISMTARGGQENGLSDRLDLHRLLRTVPDLRIDEGLVAERMRALGASEPALAAWRDVVARPLAADQDDDAY